MKNNNTQNQHHRLSKQSINSTSTIISISSSPTDWRSIFFATVMASIGAIAMMSIQVNSWPYLLTMDSNSNPTFYGIAKSACTFGTISAAVVSGYFSNKLANIKPSMLIAVSLNILTCVCYANMEVLTVKWRQWSFLVLELFLGWGGGGVVNSWRTTLAMSSTDGDRKTATAVMSTGINVGFTVGPLIVLALSYLFMTALPLPWPARMSIYTAPVYVQALLSLACALMLAIFFDGRMAAIAEDKDNGKWATRTKKRCSVDVQAAEKECAITRPNSPSKLSRPFDCVAIIVCFIARINLSSFFLYMIALASPYTMTAFGWSSQQTVIYTTYIQVIMGFFGILVSLALYFNLLSRVQERHSILFALSIMLAFFITSYPWPFLTAEMPLPVYQQADSASDQDNSTTTLTLLSPGCNRSKYNWCDSTPAINVYVYFTGLVLSLGLAMPIGQVNLDTLYSRLLGPIKQGTMQGLFFGVGETVTLFGPPLINYCYQLYGPRPIWIAEISLLSTTIILWILCYRRLLPSSSPITAICKCAPLPAPKMVDENRNKLPKGGGSFSKKRSVHLD